MCWAGGRRPLATVWPTLPGLSAPYLSFSQRGMLFSLATLCRRHLLFNLRLWSAAAPSVQQKLLGLWAQLAQVGAAGAGFAYLRVLRWVQCAMCDRFRQAELVGRNARVVRCCGLRPLPTVRTISQVHPTECTDFVHQLNPVHSALTACLPVPPSHHRENPY